MSRGLGDGELFVGGFASGFLSRGITRIGYGVYFTTTRVIGIDVGRNGGGALGGTTAGFIQGQLMPKLSREESTKVILDLDGMKDFEFEKNEISRIEIKKPGLFGSGHLVITPSEGKPVTITLRHRIAYDRLVQLTQAFGPRLVTSS